MALLWIDGFENYGATIDAVQQHMGTRYTIAWPTYIYVAAGRNSGLATRLYQDGVVQVKTPSLSITDATMIIGIACKFWNGFPGSTMTFLAMYDGATLGMNLRIKSDGQVACYLGNDLLATTTDAGISSNTFFYLEFKVVCDESGSYEVRIDGVNKLSDTEVDTRIGSNNYHSAFMLTGPTTFDDLYCLDGSGSLNNDFLGDCQVKILRPNAAGDSTQFTPDSGDNYARINETLLDEETSYVQSDIAENKDLYNYDDIYSFQIYGIVCCTNCRTVTTNSTLKTICKSGLIESDDSGQLVNSSLYSTKSRVLETDPNTANSWNPTNLNNAQFGIKVG